MRNIYIASEVRVHSDVLIFPAEEQPQLAKLNFAVGRTRTRTLAFEMTLR